ncbi:MAG TPA: hypothetical protein DHW71_05500 [Gammaproteobacteria bacterium]|nr:class I SAM-dependent methyltransferase [Pseudomonadota bacterium]HBF09603.1 hypothetical protein [Gammaproteobacteria bacterium]HCK92417.1 hypothetical protein [Gammaproteobacteria bacterium]|tara:strand:- start:318 stop:1076 length:759 start_codon:yes stop_codon:yes gene_type:complete
MPIPLGIQLISIYTLEAYMNRPIARKRSLKESLCLLQSRYLSNTSYTVGALKHEQMLHNRFWEWFYKADTYGLIDQDIPDGNRYEPMPYLLMAEILNRLELKPNDVYADIGSGKGRSLILASQRNVSKVIGIEYSKELVDVARVNVARLKQKKAQVEHYCGLAQEFDYSEVTCIYFYNSFGEETLREVMASLEKSLEENPRELRIAYANPQCKQVFEESKYFEQYDVWEGQDFPDFWIYPPQPIAVSFWRTY